MISYDISLFIHKGSSSFLHNSMIYNLITLLVYKFSQIIRALIYNYSTLSKWTFKMEGMFNFIFQFIFTRLKLLLPSVQFKRKFLENTLSISGH